MPDADHTTASADHAGCAAPVLALRPKQAAKALGIGERKLWEITADRASGIPHVRFGRAVVYPVDALRHWLTEKAKRNWGGE